MADHRNFSEIIADEIFLYTILMCDDCANYMEFGDLGKDLIQWSKEKASIAIDAGWTSYEDEKHSYCYCPNCKT